MFLIKEEAVNPEVFYKLVVVNNFAKFIRKALNLKETLHIAPQVAASEKALLKICIEKITGKHHYYSAIFCKNAELGPQR